MKHRIFWIALLALMILHHDWWFWTDGSLLLGFLPVGLAYHSLISLAAGGLWTWAVYFVLADYLTDAEPAADSVQAIQDAE